MKKKEKAKTKVEEVTLNEPTASYSGKNRIQFYNSFEEANQAEIAFIIEQSPVERLKHTVELILRAYNTTRAELSARTPNNRINIIRNV